MLTGLYTHQTGCMITGGSTLDPGFPTWGTMLREQGYQTRWLGKWHLTHHDNHWSPAVGEAALEEYGFAGGIFPSPDGGPGQGWHTDPRIAAGFGEWFRAEGRSEPWCTTVSFVNPHDIAWWYVWSDRVAAEATARPTVSRLPPNFETPELLDQRRKPRLQRSLQETAASSFGPVPFEGPEAVPIWLAFLDLYAKLQREVDRHIGNVLRTLESRPEVAANTVIVFTSDHGEYAASHGLRGKGASAYEEATRVPLIVKDPRGKLTSHAGDAPDAARLERRSGAVDAEHRDGLERMAPGGPLRPSRQPPRSRGDPCEPERGRAALHPPRHRRGRHRVRRRSLFRQRAAAHRLAAHARGEVRDLLALARKGSNRPRPDAKSSSTTTRPTPGDSRSTTPRTTARSSRGLSNSTNTPSTTSCASRSPSG